MAHLWQLEAVAVREQALREILAMVQRRIDDGRPVAGMRDLLDAVVADGPPPVVLALQDVLQAAREIDHATPRTLFQPPRHIQALLEAFEKYDALLDPPPPPAPSETP